MRSFGAQPLLFAPGSAHYYSNPGILLAAEAVGRALAGTLGERVPGPAVGRYHPFVHERILAPLGMESSALLPPPEWDGRIAWVERTGTEGMDWEGANSRYYRTLGIPWGGLFSRPRELVRYVDLFLPLAGGRQRVGAGAGEGVQLVSPATAQAMTAVQFGPPDAPPELAPELRDSAARTPPLAAVEWGLGWTVKGTQAPALQWRADLSADLRAPGGDGDDGLGRSGAGRGLRPVDQPHPGQRVDAGAPPAGPV